MKRFLRLCLQRLTGFVLLCASVGSAKADIVYSQNFDSGSAMFTTNDRYWTSAGSSGYNGQIVQSSANIIAGSGAFGPAIPQDASGSGYFLFEGTPSYPGNPTIPSGAGQFFISSNFTVAQNTNYTISFEMTDANGINNPSVQAIIGGQTSATTFAPVGAYGLGQGWQTFSFTWNSGSNTSANLILNDLQQNVTGNDFGVDDIQVATTPTTATPEPATLTLLGIGALGLMGHGWRRKQRSAMVTG